jgi:hypothetical protein
VEVLWQHGLWQVRDFIHFSLIPLIYTQRERERLVLAAVPQRETQ